MNSENTTLTVEWAPFQTAAHVNENELQQVADALEKNFLQHQQGYVRRELLKGKETHLLNKDSPQASRQLSLRRNKQLGLKKILRTRNLPHRWARSKTRST